MIVELFETERMYLVRRGVASWETGSTKSKLGLDLRRGASSLAQSWVRLILQVEWLRKYGYYAGIVITQVVITQV